MKKIVSLLALCLLMLPCISLNAFAADNNSLNFLNKEWSKENLYPDWYGGRYLDNGKMTYVVVDGYQTQIATILLPDSYVLKKHSYNKLMITINEITDEWMSTQPKNETVCLQSAALDEINNCISIELYTGSDKVDTMRNALYDQYGSLITISTTDSLIQLTTKPEQQNFYWMFIAFALLAIIGMFLIWRKQTSRKMAMQTVCGNIIESSHTISMAETVSAIKSETVSPNNRVFEQIMNDIEKT